MLETLFNKIEYVIADKNEFVFPIPFLHPHNIRCYVLVGHGVKKLRIEEDFTVEKKENYRDGADHPPLSAIMTWSADGFPVSAARTDHSFMTRIRT